MFAKQTAEMKEVIRFIASARAPEDDAGGRLHKERLYSMDIARGFAVLFMITLHVMMIHASPEAQGTSLGGIIMLLGTAPGAPVFMFLMGLFLVYGQPHTTRARIMHGVKLILAGYLLNAIRFLPVYLGLYFSLVSPERVLPHTSLTLLTYVDILQFAGLSIILLTLLKKLVKRPLAWIALAGAAAAAAPLLWGATTGLAYLDLPLQLICGSGANVAFPFFPWVSYPLLGMAYGRLLLSVKSMDRFFQAAFSAGLLLFIIGGMVSLTNPAFHIGDYFRSGPGAVMMISGFVLSWLSVSYWMLQGLREGILFKVLRYWSENVTVMYFIHWVLICWGAGFVVGEFNVLGLNESLAQMAIIVPLASLICYLWVSLTGTRDTRLARLIYH